MLTALALLGVLVALFLAAALATRERAGLAPAPRDAADLALPPGPVRSGDVRELRFGLAARGYRMSEVDAALERLAAEIDERDRRIDELDGPGAAAPGERGDATGTDVDERAEPVPAGGPRVPGLQGRTTGPALVTPAASLHGARLTAATPPGSLSTGSLTAGSVSPPGERDLPTGPALPPSEPFDPSGR